MVQLNDLSDDCLIEVLGRLSAGQLFKVQRLNKRMKRLAEVKMQTNIKAITWIKDNQLFSRCHDHLGSSSRKQMLFLGKKFKNPRFLTTRTLFLNLLTKCTGIKSLEFVDFNPPADFLFEAVRRCPELECFKLIDSMVKEEDWSKLLDQIGHKIIHFEIRHYYYKLMNAQVHNKMLALVAEKCPNIKRVDWLVTKYVSKDVVATFKLFPKNCWITLDCEKLRNVFEDVADELGVSETLDWSTFGNRNTRLSKLYFTGLSLDDGHDSPSRGVEFTNLKKLEFNGVLHRPESVNCLVSSRFPRLEQFTFNATCQLAEADYDGLFQRMTTIKKLIIKYKVYALSSIYKALLPQASVGRLENLETIILNVSCFPSFWQPEEFVKKIEPYVGWISSLKKMIIKVEKTRRFRNKKTLVDGVKRMQQAEAKKKQKEKRVEIELIFAK